MMTKLMCSILLVTQHCVLLDGSKRIVKKAYKPYGPIMCNELCEGSADLITYITEDLSCRRIPVGRSSMTELRSLADSSMTVPIVSAEGSIVCLKGDMMMTFNTSAQATTEETLCDPNSDGTGQSGLPSQSATESFAAGHRGLNHTKALHQACSEGNLCLVQYILSHRLADINCKDASGRTPVTKAVRAGHFAIFEFLISQDCDLTTLDRKNNTLLHIASRVGQTLFVEKLIAQKCDMNSRNLRGWTPVMWAVYYGHMEVVELLIRAGCNTTAVNNKMNNILHLACLTGKLDMVQYILSQDIINIDCKGEHGGTPVMMVGVRGFMRIFYLLVSSNCSLKAADDDNNTLIHRACATGNLNIVKYIIKQIPTLTESRGFNGRTPVLLAALKGDRKLFDLLFSNRCNLHAVDVYGNNILHMACHGGHIDLVNDILRHGFERGKMNHVGQTPAVIAQLRGYEAIGSLLGARNYVGKSPEQL